MQALADVHDTPASWLLSTPAGLGVDWIAQLLPFQRSANVITSPPLLREAPTAVQALAAVHDTAYSALPVAPVGAGVRRIVQLVPSQTSANVTVVPALLM